MRQYLILPRLIAGMLAEHFDGKLTLAYGFSPAPSLGGTLLRSGSPQQRVDRMGRRMKAEAESRLKKARRSLKLSSERTKIHVEEGHPVEVITALRTVCGRPSSSWVLSPARHSSACSSVILPSRFWMCSRPTFW